MVCNVADILSRINFTEIATVVMAIFTVCLWWSTTKLWKTTKEAIDLTQKEFIATHRPKLKVHSICLQWYTEDERPWRIQCSITNIGESDATITKSNMTFCEIPFFLPTVLPFNDQDHILNGKLIKPGEYIIGEPSIEKKVAEALYRKTWDQPRRDNKEMTFYFFGYIDYLDSNGTIRKTAFCRQYNLESQCFTAVQGDDYEYSY